MFENLLRPENHAAHETAAGLLGHHSEWGNYKILNRWLTAWEGVDKK